jgi:hypothetical protein
MDTPVSATARRIARYWADGTDRSTCAVRGIARQIQDHLDHGADPEHLHRLAGWMSITHPQLQDLELALDYPSAPQPAVPARSGHPCRCRAGSTGRRRGAPAPALIRQLIRRPQLAA